jgi:hypothetical protein
MAYARHFQPFKTVLLDVGLRAGRPSEEKPVPLYSQDIARFVHNTNPQ